MSYVLKGTLVPGFNRTIVSLRERQTDRQRRRERHRETEPEPERQKETETESETETERQRQRAATLYTLETGETPHWWKRTWFPGRVNFLSAVQIA